MKGSYHTREGTIQFSSMWIKWTLPLPFSAQLADRGRSYSFSNFSPRSSMSDFSLKYLCYKKSYWIRVGYEIFMKEIFFSSFFSLRNFPINEIHFFQVKSGYSQTRRDWSPSWCEVWVTYWGSLVVDCLTWTWSVCTVSASRAGPARRDCPPRREGQWPLSGGHPAACLLSPHSEKQSYDHHEVTLFHIYNEVFC